MEKMAMYGQRIFAVLVLAACWTLPGSLRAEGESGVTSPELGSLRLSAIVSSGTRHLAGFVDADSGAAYLIPVGGKLMYWRVAAIDEKSMSARLVNKEGREIRLELKGDPAAVSAEAGQQETIRIKTLDEFMGEHPELTQVPLEDGVVPAASPGATSYEAFLASHPEMAGLTNYVAPELRQKAGLRETAPEPIVDLPETPSGDVP